MVSASSLVTFRLKFFFIFLLLTGIFSTILKTEMSCLDKNAWYLTFWQLNAEAAVVRQIYKWKTETINTKLICNNLLWSVNLYIVFFLIFQFCEEWVILSSGCLFTSFQYLALVEMWWVCAGVQKMCLKQNPTLDLILAEGWSEQVCTVFLAIFYWLKNNLFD